MIFVLRDAGLSDRKSSIAPVGPSEAEAAATLSRLRQLTFETAHALWGLRARSPSALSKKKPPGGVWKSVSKELERNLTTYFEDLPVTLAERNAAEKYSASLEASPLLLDEVRVQFVVARQSTSVILTTSSRQVSHSMPIDSHLLAEKVSAIRLALQSRTNVVPLAQDLYGVLLRPLETELALARPRRVSIVLDGPLRYLPFAALHDGEQYFD